MGPAALSDDFTAGVEAFRGVAGFTVSALSLGLVVGEILPELFVVPAVTMCGFGVVTAVVVDPWPWPGWL
jgi:hypothetical protein